MTPKQFEKWLKTLEPQIKGKITRIMIEGGDKVRTLAQENVRKNSFNTGNLHSKIESTANIIGDIAVEIIVGTSVEYAPFVEYGSGPHKSSNGSKEFKEDLKRWCDLHGLPFIPIYRKIVRNGIKEKPFLIPAFNKIEPKLKRALEKVLKEIK